MSAKHIKCVYQYYTVEEGYKEGHLHTDVKLLVGYSSCLLAGGAFLFEYYTSFEEAKPIVTVAVVVFWILQAFFWLYTTFVEKNVVYIGYKQDVKSGEVNRLKREREMMLDRSL